MKGTVLDCGHPPTEVEPGSVATGTAYGPDGASLCYACAAEWTRADMVSRGNGILYVSSDGKHVTDWPGVLRFRRGPAQRTRIGFLFRAEIAYFVGPDGKTWSARGEGPGMYCRVRRLSGAYARRI